MSDELERSGTSPRNSRVDANHERSSASQHRYKGLAAGGFIFLVVAAERIAEWSMYGYSSSQGRHLPAAQGTQALVTGVVIAICGVWMIVLGLQRKHTTQESPTSTGGSAPSSCQNSPQEARRSQHAAAQQGVELDVE